MTKGPPSATQTPLHRRLEASFRTAVASGDWALGARIPTELELTRRHGASRHTVRQALSALVHDGILERRAGDGSYVRHVPAAQALAPWFSLTAELERRGVRAQTRLVGHEVGEAGTAGALLHLGGHEPVHRITRRHDYRSQPIAVEVITLPQELVGDLRDHELSGSIHALLGRRGLEPVRARIDVSIGSKDEIPEPLRAGLGATSLPLARLERLSFLPDATPLEHILFWYPHDIEEWLLTRPRQREE